MLPLERQNEILRILDERHAVSVEEFCRLLYASGATVRRDLKLLEDSGLLRRSHGGAVRLDGGARDYPLVVRETEHPLSKDDIARKALPLIRDGQTLFMDSSTTVCHLAARLNGFQGLRVITNGLKTIEILAAKEGIEVYGTGGRLRDSARSFVGAQAAAYIGQFHADLFLFSCRGLSPAAGVTEANEEEADVKRALLQHADRAVLLADGSKFGEAFFCRICALSRVDEMITDGEVPPAYIHSSVVVP